MQPQTTKATAIQPLICRETPRAVTTRAVPRKSANGRPAFQATSIHRKLAHLLASRGIPQHEIAGFIGISPKTLRKHLRRELTLGMIEANLAVLKALHKMACSGKRKHLAAAVFWSKCRCGFSPAVARPSQPALSPASQLHIYRREKPALVALTTCP